MTDKRYYVTERQLRDLKAILEGYEDAPKEINEAGKEQYEAEGGDDWGDVTDAIDGYMCEPNRELRFLVEDIEAQALEGVE